MDQQLQLAAESQGQWSATANTLKEDYDRARWIVFALSVTGALLAAIASQTDGETRLALAVAGAVLFSIVSLLTARQLNGARSQAWVRARAASEALKRESYKYAARAAPYDDPATRERNFREEIAKVEVDVEDLLGQREKGKPGSTPMQDLKPAEYLEKRVKAQIDKFFEPKAASYQSTAKAWRHAEFALALATTCLTAALGVAKKEIVGGVPFDFAALIAVLTTVSGAVLAYIEASRYDFTVTLYRATARRLRAQLYGAPAADVAVPSPEWSTFVHQCEAILQDENSSWVAKFGKPAA